MFTNSTESFEGRNEATEAGMPADLLQGKTTGGSKNGVLTDERKRVLEKDLGVKASALRAMSEKGATDFLGLIASGPRTAALSVRVVNAVSRTSKGRVNEAIEKLSSYPGNLSILEDFLNRIGTDDPFLATERAQVVVLPVSELPRSAVVTEDELEPTAISTGPKESVRGASGHIITGMIYCAYDKDSPVDSIGFFSKRQAVTRPFETFNPGRFSAEKTATVRERRENSFRDILSALALEDLECVPSLAGAFKSPVILRDFAVYNELKLAIQEYREKLAGLTYGEDVEFSAPSALRVRTDTGGTFLGWFERQIESGADLPEGILVAYQSIKDPDVHLDPATERDYIRGLIAYQRVHSFISKNAALAGIASDLKEFDALSPGDPLTLDIRIVEAKREVQELAASPQSDIRVTDLAAVISRAGLADFRREMNRRTLSRYGREYEEALSYFEPFFIKNGSWLEDSVQGSVPMSRLSNTIYGAKVGASHYPDKGELKPCLSLQDFRRALDGVFHKTISGDDQTRLLSSMPIKDFRENVEGVIVAYRKARFMDSSLREYEKQCGISSAADPQWAETLPAGFKPVLPRGNDMRPVEIFMEKERNSGKTVMPLDEVMARVKARNLGDYKAKSELPQINACVEAGLYPERSERLLKSLHNGSAHYIPATQVADAISTVQEMLASPLVRINIYNGQELLTKPYLKNSEVLLIEDMASFKPRFDELGLQPTEEIRALGECLEQLQGATLYTGSLKPATSIYRAHLELGAVNVSTFLGGKIENNLVFHEPEELERKIAELEDEYVRTDTLPGSWFAKAKKVCSMSGRAILDAHNMDLVDRFTFFAARNLEPATTRFISKAFVDAVNALFE